MTSPVATPPPPTAAPGRTRRGRMVAAVGVVALAAAAAAGIAVARGGGSDPKPGESTQLFTTSTHTVTYEVVGDGPVEEIEYVVGAGNKLETVHMPTLPWRKEIQLDVGKTGGTALVNAANTGIGKLTCGVSVDGKPAYRITGQSETDVSCSTEIPAATTKN